MIFIDFLKKHTLDIVFNRVGKRFDQEYEDSDDEETMTIKLDFKHFNDLYKLRPNYKDAFVEHYYSRGWFGILELLIITDNGDENSIYLGSDDTIKWGGIKAWDLTEPQELVEMGINHLNKTQELIVLLDSLKINCHFNIEDELVIEFPQGEKIFHNNSERTKIRYKDKTVTWDYPHSFEEIKEYLFPILVRNERLEQLI
tara:strand:- start:1149 stop:1748 length:600 start_codon:yes stop_codon:yes gene_type:complete